jgi:hypothetical protein
LHIQFILADKGIGNELVMQEIEMDVGRKLRDWPEVWLLDVCSAKLPVCIDGDDLARRHCGGRRTAGELRVSLLGDERRVLLLIVREKEEEKKVRIE